MLEFNFSPFPTIETERLILREINDDDMPVFFKMRSDEAVMKYVDRPRPKTLEDLKPLMEQFKAGVAENTNLAWAICLKDTGEMIGNIGYWRNEPENHRGEVGYMLMPQFFGKGYASEALAAALNYGFNTMHLNSIKGCVDPENAASIHVLEKAGFVKEAHFREDYMFNGKFKDSGVYCMLRSDWDTRHK